MSDLRASAEPSYPDAALQPGDAGEAAERAYNDDVLTWGRGEHGKVERLCQFFTDLGGKFPFLCRTEPAVPKP